MAWRPRWCARRWAVTAVVAAAALVVAAVIVGTFVVRDREHRVPTAEVVDRYRSAVSTTEGVPDDGAGTSTAPPSTVAEPARASLVEPGVYQYRTEGQETVDALGGATHTYPTITTVTVLPAGCGVTMRWDALRERWDEWQLCGTEEGIALQPAGVQYHEFFGQADEETVVCDVAVVLVPPSPVTGDTVQQACSLGDDPWLPTWEVLERSTRRVDGVALDVQHVRMVVEDDDDHWEHQVVDWYLADNGLPIEIDVVKSSRSPSPIGGVVYTEVVHLEAVALAPLR